jgi:uncharacterized membrane protein
MALLVALHVLAAVVWVGGMFFAYMVLRPAAGPLETAERLALWHRVFGRFFPWVWACIVLLLVSGYVMLFRAFGGFAGAPLHVNVMQTIGIVMMMCCSCICSLRLGAASAAPSKGKPFPKPPSSLGRSINLALGLLTVAVGASGRFW